MLRDASCTPEFVMRPGVKDLRPIVWPRAPRHIAQSSSWCSVPRCAIQPLPLLMPGSASDYSFTVGTMIHDSMTQPGMLVLSSEVRMVGFELAWRGTDP
jgi:hypothetical protein